MDKFNAFSSKFHEKFMTLKIPTVNTCCCFLDLRTAGLVLGTLTIISNIILILYGAHITWSFISLFASGCWVYGILKDKPSLMFSYLISNLLGIILVIIIPLIWVIFISSDESIENPDVEPSNRLERSIVMIVILALGSIPSVYFWIVEFSLYKSTLERHTESIGSSGVGAPNEVNAGV